MLFLGIDLGSSFIKSALLDVERGEVREIEKTQFLWQLDKNDNIFLDNWNVLKELAEIFRWLRAPK
mgnify:CR=1 FL=1